MSNTQYSTLAYLMKRLFSTILVSLYIFYITGVIDGGLTSTTIKMSFVIMVSFVVITFINDFYKHAVDPKNPSLKQRASGMAVKETIPSIISVSIATAIHIGLADLYQHIMVLSILFLISCVFSGLQEYHKLKSRAEGPTNV